MEEDEVVDRVDSALQWVNMSQLVICALGVSANGRALWKLKGVVGANADQYRLVLQVTAVLSLLVILFQAVFTFLPDYISVISDYILPIGLPWVYPVYTGIEVFFMFMAAILCHERKYNYGYTTTEGTKLWKVFTPIGILSIVYCVPAFFEYHCIIIHDSDKDSREYMLSVNDLTMTFYYIVLYHIVGTLLILHFVPFVATLASLVSLRRRRAREQQGKQVILEEEGGHEIITGSDISSDGEYEGNRIIITASSDTTLDEVEKEEEVPPLPKIEAEKAAGHEIKGARQMAFRFENRENMDKVCKRIAWFFLVLSPILGALRISYKFVGTMALYYTSMMVFTIFTSLPMVLYLF